MLSHREFRKLLDSYGAEPQRWPEKQRAGAQALLSSSPEARRLLEEARRLDHAIRSASSRQDETLWRGGEQQAALARVRAGIWARLPLRTPRRSLTSRHALWSFLPVYGVAGSSSLGWVGPLAVSSAAIALGLWIGWMQTQPLASVDLFTLLQSAPIHGLAW
ncbi:MAG TPA: hypothetical protein VIX87_10455 [Steroidobacteraceae bacterium]